MISWAVAIAQAAGNHEDSWGLTHFIMRDSEHTELEKWNVCIFKFVIWEKTVAKIEKVYMFSMQLEKWLKFKNFS